MTDRELLELAAKAAGIVADYFEEDGDDSEGMWGSGYEAWNPLTDDGDALRLAMALGLVVCIMNDVGFTGVYLPAEHIGGKYDVVEHHDNDPYAATRRAIVCAAAEIGKQMGGRL